MFGAYPQTDTNGLRYSDYQERSWYRRPCFKNFDVGQIVLDVVVDQLLAARAQVPCYHCRSTQILPMI